MENYNFYARFEGCPEDQLVPLDDLDAPRAGIFCRWATGAAQWESTPR